MKITNFGGNIQFKPRAPYTPQTDETGIGRTRTAQELENKVLRILEKHATGNIRVIGSGHSWSGIAQSDDVMIDMRHFNNVKIEYKDNGKVWVEVEAGCILQDLLKRLHHQTDYTLPTMGAIKKQTISGIISTGTHGSGRPSLSHYVREIKAAAYNSETGKAEIYTYRDGEELRAARCALGCMGVILSVKIPLVCKYYVAQNIVEKESLEEILAEKEKYELQQFILVPYSWKWYSYTRHIVDGPPQGVEKLHTYLTRFINWAFVDRLLHLILKLVVALPSAKEGRARAILLLHGKFLPLVMKRKHMTIDFCEKAITMRHDLFKHLEIELFVPERNVVNATNFIRHVTAVFAGVEETVPQEIKAELRQIDMFDKLMGYKGFFTHHYPIYFRQVKPDDTLISMTAGAEE